MGANNLAGCVPVNLVEGKASLVATFMTKLRRSFKKESKDMRDQDMALPTNVILGTFMLWWGWLGFNCGPTFGVNESKWLNCFPKITYTTFHQRGYCNLPDKLSLPYRYIFKTNIRQNEEINKV